MWGRTRSAMRSTIGGNIGNASPAGDTITALMALEARSRGL
ncbi:MAG: FAD binding domain-containing protein [Syntrophaceticus schinkii]